MKRIEAIIKPFRLEEVKEAVTRAGARGMTLTEVKAFGRQKGATEIYRGAAYTTGAEPGIKVEIFVHKDMVERVTNALLESASTWRIGAGDVVVLPVEDAVRIRTGHRGVAAIY